MANEPIRVKTDELTLDDLVFLEDMGEGRITKMREIRDFFDRVVEGGAGKRKVRDMVEISKAILAKIQEESNPKETA